MQKSAKNRSNQVKVSIFTYDGKLVETPVNTNLSAGYQEIHYNTKGLKPGIYICRIETGEKQNTYKLMVTSN